MSNQDEDLLFSNDEYQPPPAWWSPSALLTPEVTSITAFTITLISTSTFRPDPARPAPWKREKNLRAKTTPGHLTGGCSDASLMRR